MFEERLTILGHKCLAKYNKTEGLPIGFLHGYSFTSKVWEKIRVLQSLEKKGIPYLAIDMPYGLKSDCTPKTRKPEVNVNFLKEALQTVFSSNNLFLVGASLGGYIALKYSQQHQVQGMLLVAPVRSLEEDLIQSYQSLEIPVYILYGSKDKIVSLNEMEELASNLSEAKLFIYRDANHPAYLDKPDDFLKHLLDIYRKRVQLFSS